MEVTFDDLFHAAQRPASPHVRFTKLYAKAESGQVFSSSDRIHNLPEWVYGLLWQFAVSRLITCSRLLLAVEISTSSNTEALKDFLFNSSN